MGIHCNREDPERVPLYRGEQGERSQPPLHTARTRVKRRYAPVPGAGPPRTGGTPSQREARIGSPGDTQPPWDERRVQRTPPQPAPRGCGAPHGTRDGPGPPTRWAQGGRKWRPHTRPEGGKTGHPVAASTRIGHVRPPRLNPPEAGGRQSIPQRGAPIGRQGRGATDLANRIRYNPPPTASALRVTSGGGSITYTSEQLSASPPR